MLTPADRKNRKIEVSQTRQPSPILTTEERCRDDKHFWPDDSTEGDTCECGQWYRFSSRIEAVP